MSNFSHDKIDKLDKIEDKILHIDSRIEKKFHNAVKIFDYLNEKIIKLENKLKNLKQKKTIYLNKYTSYIFYDGKKYRCQNYIYREKCLYRNTIREAGYDICFHINDHKCEKLIEIE